MKDSKRPFLLLLLIAMLIIFFVSLAVGRIEVSLQHVLEIICYHLSGINAFNDFTRGEEAVVWFIRMPRIILAMLVGAGLAISGAVMQGVFNNPLVDPGIVGVSAGAALGAVLAIASGIATVNIFAIPVLASLCSIVAVLFTVFLSMRKGKTQITSVLLAGVVISMFLTSITAAILLVMDEAKLQSYLFWLIGGFDFSRWEEVSIAIIPIEVGIIIMVLAAKQLNVLALGDIEARSVGMTVLFVQIGLLLVAAIVTAACVCVSGNIGFVGLVVPHMIRILLGPDYRLLLPASTFAGAAFLSGCDLLGRIIMPPTEVRVGIITALLGAPYFLFLLRRMQKNFL